MEKARKFILKIFDLLMRPELRILPGHLAFYLVMTLIPLAALIITLTASLSISTEAVYLAISETLPSSVSAILNSIIEGSGINFNLITFYLSALLLASNGTYSMINTSNEIYKIKPKDILSRRIKAIIMIFVLVLLFLFLLLVPVFGSTIFDIIKNVTSDSLTLKVIEEMLVILKYPIILFILFINIKLMYMIAPDEEIPSRTTNKGSIFTTVGWVLATEIFAFYIDKFARYDIFYGSISNILVLLLWVFILSYIYVLGMIINASDYKNEL